MPENAQRDIWHIFDGEDTNNGIEDFVGVVAAEAKMVGFPFFLRTGQTSGKHDWRRTCFVPDADSIGRHIVAIAEFSELADILGLPWDVWAIREMLPTKPIDWCPRFGDMPICAEFRFFVEDGDVQCFHPYWPLGALEQGGLSKARAQEVFDVLNEVYGLPDLRSLASKAGKAVGGAWSVDLLETERGWYITDMARASDSFHYPHDAAS